MYEQNTVVLSPGQKLTIAFPRENGGVFIHQDGKGIPLSGEELDKLFAMVYPT
jgi:hypothetical protein